MTDDQEKKVSPRILEIRWGYMKVEGVDKEGVEGKDFKLYPGGAEQWDWGKTNTSHTPGIQPKDVEDLIKHGADIIILSRGMENVLKTAQETIDYLEGRDMKLGTDYFIETTPEAVKRYNALIDDDKRVGSLIHSTC